MKVGDIVVRSYSWHALVPGIIVDEEFEIVTSPDESESYESRDFIIQWSDGSLTSEGYFELDYFEEWANGPG